jgi:hypothetical protein
MSPPGFGKLLAFGDQGQPVLGRERDDLVLMRQGEAIREDDERVGALLAEAGKRGVKVVGASHLQGVQRHAYPSGRPLRVVPLELLAGVGGVPEDGHPERLGHRLREQFEPFATDLDGLDAQARDIATGPRQAGHQAGLHGGGTDSHDNRDGAGGILERPDRGLPCPRDQDVDRETHQFRREVSKPFGSALRRAVLDGDVLAFNPAVLTQALPEDLVEVLRAGCSGGV